MEDPDSFSVNQREVLQLACELAALPNTYKVLLDILYGSSTDNDLNSNEDFVPNSYEAVNSTIGAPSAEHAQEISEFRNKLNSIINQGSLNVEATPLLDQDDRTIRIDESSNLLDGDLMEYLQKELKYKKKK